MATEIRPELSEKNPYWIGKHRYYELKHFCLQYPIWKKAYNALLGLSLSLIHIYRLAAAFACLGLSVCCAQPDSAVIPIKQLIMMLRFRTSEQHMLQIRRAV